jgi:hypothetical protein
MIVYQSGHPWIVFFYNDGRVVGDDIVHLHPRRVQMVVIAGGYLVVVGQGAPLAIDKGKRTHSVYLSLYAMFCRYAQR